MTDTQPDPIQLRPAVRPFAPTVRPFGTPVDRDAVRMVWDQFVKPVQDTGAPPSVEDRVLMAILRTAFDLLPATAAEPGESGAELGEPDQVRLPEAHENEDGDWWWIEGHVSDEVAVLAVLLQTCVYDARIVPQMLAGPYADRDLAREGVAEGITWADVETDMRDHAHELLGSVARVWLRPDPDDGDQMLITEPGTDGAEAWTRVAVDQ